MNTNTLESLITEKAEGDYRLSLENSFRPAVQALCASDLGYTFKEEAMNGLKLLQEDIFKASRQKVVNKAINEFVAKVLKDNT